MGLNIMSERRNDIDFAKGIGIVLMMLGHSYSSGNGEIVIQWLYSFHMPLFFIVSGMIKRSKNEKPLKNLVKERFIALLVPYYVWGSLAACFLTLIGKRSLHFFLECLKSIFTFSGLSAMWFLPCLFLAEIFFWFILRLHARSKLYGMILFAMFFFAGSFVSATDPLFIVLLRSATGTTFLYLGYLLAEIYNKKGNPFVLLIMVVFDLILISINGAISIAARMYGNIGLFYISALLGTWLTIQIYHYLKGFFCSPISSLFIWIGRNSLIVVCTSLYAIEFIRIFDYHFLGNILPTLGIAEGFAVCLVAVIIETGIILFGNRYLYVLFGKQKHANREITSNIRKRKEE